MISPTRAPRAIPGVSSHRLAHETATATANVDHDRWIQFPTQETRNPVTTANAALAQVARRAAWGAHQSARRTARRKRAIAASVARDESAGRTAAPANSSVATMGTGRAPSRRPSSQRRVSVPATVAAVMAYRPHQLAVRQATASRTFQAGEFG